MASDSPRILIVDDESGILEFVDRALRGAGYTTKLASNGAEALAAAELFSPFDLLLTDVRMPGMTGDDLAARIRQRFPATKVLYLTGFSDQLFKEKHRLWEDEAFLDKPATVNAVLEAVSLLLYGVLRRPAPSPASAR